MKEFDSFASVAAPTAVDGVISRAANTARRAADVNEALGQGIDRLSRITARLGGELPPPSDRDATVGTTPVTPQASGALGEIETHLYEADVSADRLYTLINERLGGLIARLEMLV